jgi:signal transduction histidine kinase
VSGAKTDQAIKDEIKLISGLTNGRSKTILTYDIRNNHNAKAVLDKHGVEVITKLVVGDQTIGFLMLGSRRSGSRYSQRDIQLLETVADSIAIAAQNALRFEEISQFNVNLQKKVDDATAKIQRSNEKLQKLDEAKDDFISMASHQLRTPLTSVKGYISMMLEGDAGEINEQQMTFLDQAFMSSQRMVYIIADLLNVSRLKTGKFLIEPKPTYLPDIIESEINQLLETAKARELKLVFHKPKSFPTLNLDEVKTRQVIMNFMDNAIYYTPKGGKITLTLKDADGSIVFTVHDTGIGVPKQEVHHLFTKFYRAGNAKKARPDGTGLGLFMAKKVIVAQGGAIVFETEEGKGSTFGFTFPRAKLEAATPES